MGIPNITPTKKALLMVQTKSSVNNSNQIKLHDIDPHLETLTFNLKPALGTLNLQPQPKQTFIIGYKRQSERIQITNLCFVTLFKKRQFS